MVGSLAGAAAWGQEKTRVKIFNVTTGYKTALILCNNTGGNPQTLGKIVSSPQVCGSGQYGTAEWIKEITYVAGNPSQADWTDARNHLAVGNGPNALGCGHISKNVQVKQAVKDGSGVWSEQPYAANTAYYCLVAAGSQNGASYEASAIWISTTDWDTSLPALQKACCLQLPVSQCGPRSGPPCSKVTCATAR